MVKVGVRDRLGFRATATRARASSSGGGPWVAFMACAGAAKSPSTMHMTVVDIELIAVPVAGMMAFGTG